MAQVTRLPLSGSGKMYRLPTGSLCDLKNRDFPANRSIVSFLKLISSGYGSEGECKQMLPALWNEAVTQNMFHMAVPVAEKMLRPIIVYVFLVMVLRIFGKRELAQLNPFDLVVLLSLSNTVQNAIIGEDNTVTGGLIGAFTLLAINYFVVRFVFKHRRLDQMIEGTPTVLIEHGQVCRDQLAKELLTESELLMVAHRQGFASLEEIEQCVLEPGGTFFLEGKKPAHVDRQHNELLSRLEDLSKQIAELKKGETKG
jgi:uncharacterized membrane protein YcaP (DUF421 family)